jgi:hypothetical protein
MYTYEEIPVNDRTIHIWRIKTTILCR